MKTKIVNDKPTSYRRFPKLMQCNGIEGFIVLMYSSSKLNNRGAGTVISVGATNDWKLGEYSNEWTTSLFSDFEGTLELSND